MASYAGTAELHMAFGSRPRQCVAETAEKCEACGTRGKLIHVDERDRDEWHHLSEHRHSPGKGCWTSVWSPHTVELCRYTQKIVEPCRTPGPVLTDDDGRVLPRVVDDEPEDES